MNRKILFLIAGAVIAVAASWNVIRSMSEGVQLSDVALENVEALASENYETDDCNMVCRAYICAYVYYGATSTGDWYRKCPDW
jgi:hypothetical protein